MNCSPEEALSRFFRPWLEDGTPLVLTIGDGMEGSEACTVLDISPGRVLVRSNRGEFVLASHSASFSYEDWRGFPPPEGVTRKWLCFLRADFPDGRSLLFAEPGPGMRHAF
jgi:hypothetical protein